LGAGAENKMSQSRGAVTKGSPMKKGEVFEERGLEKRTVIKSAKSQESVSWGSGEMGGRPGGMRIP